MTEPADTLDEGRLVIHHDFVWLLHHHGLDTFESFYDEDLGELLRDLPARSNVRLTLESRGRPVTFFLKRHEPASFLEKLRAWLRLRRPSTPARTEWENIQELARLGIATMPPIAFGEDPGTGRSFVMTAKIDFAEPADDFARGRLTPRRGAAAAGRRKFVRRLGELVRKLHAAGLTHRDLYLCHIFVREIDGDYRLYLIDLQRLGPRVFKRRWKVKDLAQLEFSRPRVTLSNTDAMRFLLTYFGVECLGPNEKRFARSVLRKVKRMKREAAAKEATR